MLLIPKLKHIGTNCAMKQQKNGLFSMLMLAATLSELLSVKSMRSHSYWFPWRYDKSVVMGYTSLHIRCIWLITHSHRAGAIERHFQKIKDIQLEICIDTNANISIKMNVCLCVTPLNPMVGLFSHGVIILMNSD